MNKIRCNKCDNEGPFQSMQDGLYCTQCGTMVQRNWEAEDGPGFNSSGKLNGVQTFGMSIRRKDDDNNP